MKLETFIFIGRSGCGKGTQAKLLEEYLKKRDPKTKVLYLETGDRFREFISKDSFSSKLSKTLYTEAARQPDFLAIYMWADALVKELKGNEHLIIDGTPRSLSEAKVLSTALPFYKRESPAVIYLNVSRKLSEDRLRARGRGDDLSEKNIKRRLDWFDTDVLPELDYLKKEPLYRFIEVDGEKKVEDVYEEIISKLFK